MLFDELMFIERVQLLKLQYQCATGYLPTRLIMTPSDLLEFQRWLVTSEDITAYIAEPYTCEPMLHGMMLRVELYAAEMHVFFQES
jgi:hypothetical protein